MAIIEDMGHAASLIRQASRIMVVGSSGAGKTTLSRRLATYLHIDYFSIDRDVRRLSGWDQRQTTEQHAILKEIVARDRWLLDGSNPSTFDMRLPRTDIVIWMRLPRIHCLLSVARRVTKFYGTVRPDMVQGCKEPFPDRDFLNYIWNFEKRHAPVFLRNFDAYGPQVPIFQVKSRQQANQLLDLICGAH